MSTGSKLMKSSFLFWIVGAVVASFIFISFDYKAFQNSDNPLALRLLDSFSFKNLQLGIDLRGGTRLVLRVDIDQAIENKLLESGKSVETFLKKSAKINTSSKSLTNKTLNLDFASADSSYNAYLIAKEQFPELEIKQSQEQLNIKLNHSEESRIKSDAVEKAIHVLNTRLDTVSVKGLSTSRHGDHNIVVQLPGVSDLADIKDMIMRAARLEFKTVFETGSRDSILNRYDGVVPADKILVSSKAAHEESAQWYLVPMFPDVTGSHIKDARPGYDDNGGRMGGRTIQFSFDSEGARDFREVTRASIGKQLAIIMDGKVISAPVIQSEIGAEGRITGVSDKEAIRVSQLLRSGALDAPLKIIQESNVGASLGKDSISQGLTSCLLALLMLLIFSIAYYKLSGVLAMTALLYNLLMLMIMLAFFGATLTLPGIAGMILTVGMAIDSSILIFEKIKEELVNHASYRQAIDSGFDGAMVVILDSNITTFLAGIVLFWYGGPAVRGFAVTLMLGVVSTVIAGVFFLRSFFNFLLDFVGMKKISM